MNSYARGHELLHKAGEILQTRHIPQSLSSDLKHKAADTALWIRKVLNHLSPDTREVKDPLQNSFLSPLFPGHLQGTTTKTKMLHWWTPGQTFKPALLLSLEEDAPQRVKSCYWCCFGAIWSSSSPCYQGSCSRGTCRLSPSCCKCPGTKLSLPACQETQHQASSRANVQPSPHCHTREIVAVTRNWLQLFRATLVPIKVCCPLLELFF